MKGRFTSRFFHIGIGIVIVSGAIGISLISLAKLSGPKEEPRVISIQKNPTGEKNNPVETASSLNALTKEVTSTVSNETPDTSDNATQSLVKKIAASILEKNPDGPSLLDGKLSISGEDPQALLEAAISETVETFNYHDWKPDPNSIEVVLGTKNTKEAASAYLTSFFETLQYPF